MAAGIEHRSAESVLNSYQDYDLPNFSIWNGKRLCIKYDQGNADEGYQALVNYLNTIAQSNTMAVYTLKVYPEKCTGITNGTLYEGSTTFMLSPAATTIQQNGVTIIDPSSKTAQYGSKELVSRIEKLEQENVSLRDKLHKEELDRIRQDFTHQISGLNREQEEKSGWDKFLDILERKPEMLERGIDRFFDGAGKIAGLFRTQKNYILEQPASRGAIAGTENKSEPINDTAVETSYDTTAEGAMINPFLTIEESRLKSGAQSEIIRSKLEPLTQDQHDDIQSECMEAIEKRLGPVTLSLMLLKVASLDNADMNKLLNNLD